MNTVRKNKILFEVGQAIERAAELLPVGNLLTIEIERGAGTITLTHPGTQSEGLNDWPGDDFGEQINAAIDYAIALEGK